MPKRRKTRLPPLNSNPPIPLKVVMNRFASSLALGSAVILNLSGCCSSTNEGTTQRGKAASNAKKPSALQDKNPSVKTTETGNSPLPSGANGGRNVENTLPQITSQNRARLIQLEAEEIRIRTDISLSPAERQQLLQKVWKEQTDANSQTPATGTPPPSLRDASPANPANSAQTTRTNHDAPTAQSAPVNAPAPKLEAPKYAAKVPGKPGIIKSPYDGKLLDAVGIPTGTEVKDPATGKIMLVP